MKSLIILLALTITPTLFAGTDTGTVGIFFALEGNSELVESDEILDLAEIKIPDFDPTSLELIDEELLKLAGSDTGTSGIHHNLNVLAANGKIMVADLGFKPVAIPTSNFKPGMVRFVDANDTNVVFEAFGNNKTSTYVMPIKALENFLPEKMEALETSSFDGSWVEIKGL